MCGVLVSLHHEAFFRPSCPYILVLVQNSRIDDDAIHACGWQGHEELCGEIVVLGLNNLLQTQEGRIVGGDLQLDTANATVDASALLNNALDFQGELMTRDEDLKIRGKIKSMPI